MKVTEIVIFPVKSCAGVSVEHSKINQFGLEFDRFWVIARKRDQWEMMTQRNFSRMVLIKPEIELNRLVLRAPDMSDITVPLESKGESIQIKVWDDLVYGISQGDEVSQWLTKCLGVKCALFAKDLNNVRTLSPEHTPSNSLFAYQPQTAFADGFPFLLLSEESINDFAKYHPDPSSISTRNFRPNIVVNSCKPYEEDTLIKFVINGVTFYGASRCTRCLMTNNNPETGIPGKETLKLLQKIRRVDPGAKYQGCLGLNLIHQNETGIIHVGDEVMIEQSGEHDRRGIWNGNVTPTRLIQ